jgi:hypothetical protein
MGTSKYSLHGNKAMRFVLCRAVFREGYTMFTIRLAGGLHVAPLDEDNEEKVAK